MRKRTIAFAAAGLLLLGAGTAAYVISPTVHSGTAGEAPELGRTGEHAIGTDVKTFALEGRTKITAWGAVSGNLSEARRELSVRFWYPADIDGETKAAQYEHEMRPPGKEPVAIVSKGIAIADAPPLDDQKFPLVLMSHGFGGWSTQFSNLAEHIASHGYVVASIDHGDMPVEGVTSFLLSFGNVLADRMLDQRQVLDKIVKANAEKSSGYFGQIDPDNVGLIGYSMGGYGAIATAGANYDFANDPMASVPEAARSGIETAMEGPAQIKALVAIAPWGGQPDNRAWNAASLSKIKQPVLFISGNQDDVVNFKEGVSWLFENMTAADRHMLVYREARHNIVGNAFTLDSDADFTVSEFLKEPVWRSERLNAINQHFVTAFLDKALKGETAKAAYLNVPTVDSNTGIWPIGFGEQLNGKMAGPEQDKHWRGFQRRWAVGLEMHHLKKKQ